MVEIGPENYPPPIETPDATSLVLERVDRFRGAWEEFIESGRSLGAWTIAPDDRQLFAAFVRAEGTEAGLLPDLLISLDAPSSSADFESQWIDALGLALESPPSKLGFDDTLRTWLEAHGTDLRVLGLVLRPALASPSVRGWVEARVEAVERARTRPDDALSRVRYLLVDPRAWGFPEDWPNHASDKVLAAEPRAEGAELMPELARLSATSGGAGAAFRLAFAELGAAWSRQALPDARAAHERARAVADREGWTSLAALADVAFASGMCGLGAYAEASEVHARAAGNADAPPQLRQAALMGCATAKLLDGRPREAAERYREAAEAAEELPKPAEPGAPDIRMSSAFEAHRCAAHAALEAKDELGARTDLEAALGELAAAAPATRACMAEDALCALLERAPRLVPELRDLLERAELPYDRRAAASRSRSRASAAESW